MTDLYIRREQPSKRPIFIAVGIIVLIVVALGFYHLHRRSKAEPAAPAVTEVSAHETGSSLLEPPAAAPAPKPAPRVETKETPPKLERTPPPAAGSDSATRTLAEARRLQSEGDLLGAREAALAAIANATSASVRREAEAVAGAVNTDLVFSPRDMPGKEPYIVASGDSLDRIARKFKTTVELLQKSNGITGALIHPGDRLRILTGEFAITIDKSENDLILYLNGQFFKRYRVGTGEYNKTPVGQFKITEKIKHPPWWRPDGKQIPYGDPENLLGTHWLSLDIRGYGIHGTWEPETIGKQSSAGCVRLLNEEIEELYALVPVGTPVEIVD